MSSLPIFFDHSRLTPYVRDFQSTLVTGLFASNDIRK